MTTFKYSSVVQDESEIKLQFNDGLIGSNTCTICFCGDDDDGGLFIHLFIFSFGICITRLNYQYLKNKYTDAL